MRHALLAAMLWSVVCPALAEEQSLPDKAQKLTPVRALALSVEVAEFGRASKDPVALIVAAGIRKSVVTKMVERRPDAAPAEARQEDDPDRAEALLAEAVALSKNDPAIRAMAQDVRASASKGRAEGVAISLATAKGGGSDWYRKIRYDAGKYAEAAVELLGGGALDILVYDSSGNIVCRDMRQPKTGYCGWTPKPGETFDIKIENRHPTPVRYRLSTN